MLDIPQITIVTIILFVILRTVKVHTRHSTTNAYHKLPPGPPGIPLLGNLLQVPRKHLATYFRGLIEEYGGLVSLNLAGLRIVLVGDIKVAKQLLEKHAAKHSSRPVLHFVVRYHVDPMETYWAFHPEGQSHSLGRKLSAGIMSTVRAGKTEPLQQFEAALHVQKLLDDRGQDWFNHISRFSSSTVLTAGYGMRCLTGHETDLKELLYVLEEFVLLSNPSASIINALPFLDIIPGSTPWRIRARNFHKRDANIYKKLLDKALKASASGANTWAATFAGKDKYKDDQSHPLKTFIGAAIETTTISLRIFVLACLRYPEWVGTAQQEIDNVVGHDRLPSFRDRPLLPYIDAVVRETIRWRPAARLGMPHQSIADDVIEYRGREYFIPAGTTIFSVTWAMEHDQSRFEDHDRFMPERFLDANGNLKANYETSAFGFGRRVCPGIPFAERSLWINIVMVLWTFNIRASVDSQTGLPFRYDDGDAAFNGDLTNSPFPFPAVFEPRSPQRATVARREWGECEKDLDVLFPAPREE